MRSTFAVLTVAALTVAACGDAGDPGATPGGAATTTAAVTGPPTLSVAYVHEPAGASPAEGEVLEVAVSTAAGEVIHSQSVDMWALVTEPTRDGMNIEYGEFPLFDMHAATGAYRVRGTVTPSGDRCEAEVTVLDGVAIDVRVVTGCVIQWEEQVPWHNEAAPGEEAVGEFWGPQHCGWEEIRFIHFGGYESLDVYVGTPAGTFPESYFISRATYEKLGLDPDLPPPLSGGSEAMLGVTADRPTFADSATLPGDAEFTGWKRGAREIWTSPSDGGDHIYVVSPQGVERWPWMAYRVYCE